MTRLASSIDVTESGLVHVALVTLLRSITPAESLMLQRTK